MRKLAVTAAWIAVMGFLVWQCFHGKTIASALWGGAVASLVSGAAIGRWWAIALPPGTAAVTFLVAYLVVPDCGDCEFGRVGGLFLLLFLLVPTTTATMAAGVLGRRIARFLLAARQDAEA